MEEVNYYIDTYSNSLLEDNSNSIKPLDRVTSEFLLKEGRNYFSHILEYVKQGRLEFKARVEEARLIVFNKIEFTQWIEKFKQDCEGETKRLCSEFNATFGHNEKSNLQYLGKTGRLIGLFMEAERIEKMVNAINPINKKQSYEKLDALDAFDKFLIEKGEIPGYYSTPSHIMEKPQKYQIRTLEKEWLERLDWGAENREKILEKEFGKIDYYFYLYHQEFKWTLINIRPRQDIKSFLSFHYDKFKYDKEIFIDHIDCRIKLELKDFVSSNHLTYEIIIEDWVAEKRDLVTDESEIFLISKIYGSCEKFLDDIIENRKRNDENLYNILIKNYINAGIEDRSWKAYDQSMGGKTLTLDGEPSQAFRDIIIVNRFGNRISAIECLRVKSIPGNNLNPEEYINIHVNKIFHNEPIGISPLFIIVYAEQIKFEEAWVKYFEYINILDFPKYNKIEIQEFKVNNIDSANLKILLSKHKREMNVIKMYHFFINMNP